MRGRFLAMEADWGLNASRERELTETIATRRAVSGGTYLAFAHVGGFAAEQELLARRRKEIDLTITIINAAVGIAMALAMWLTGVGDPILWGTVAFLLNYVPILGTALGVLIFLLAGLLTIDSLWQALLPAALYLGFHLIEGETVTPMLLARRFTLNPVLVIISLVFWFWMWGIPGAILSVPMLAIAKIICDGVRPLAALGHFLER